MNWVIKENNDNESVKKLSSELNISPILSSMLVNRDVKTFDEAKTFFNGFIIVIFFYNPIHY